MILYAILELHSIDITTRGIVAVPEASIIHEVLRVSFSSSGIYSLTVSDSFGSPVYISSLPAGGRAPFRQSRAWYRDIQHQ